LVFHAKLFLLLAANKERHIIVANEFSSTVKELSPDLAYLGQSQPINEIDDLPQARFDDGAAGAGDGKSEH
jgi:hypothetical protein